MKMTVFRSGFQLLMGKIDGVCSGGKKLSACVNAVSAAPDCGIYAFETACGSKYLGLVGVIHISLMPFLSAFSVLMGGCQVSIL